MPRRSIQRVTDKCYGSIHLPGSYLINYSLGRNFPAWFHRFVVTFSKYDYISGAGGTSKTSSDSDSLSSGNKKRALDVDDNNVVVVGGGGAASKRQKMMTPSHSTGNYPNFNFM